MKRIICFSMVSAVVIIAACSPKTHTAAVATTSTGTSAPIGPAPAPTTDISAAQVDAAKTKYPDATMDALKRGHDIYFGATCTRCHGAKKITNFSADELPDIIENMARKARISPEEKDAVLKYVIGVNLAAK